MVVKVFISSNQTEFSEERKFLYDELNKDSFFNETIKLYVLKKIKQAHYHLMKYLLMKLSNQTSILD